MTAGRRVHATLAGLLALLLAACSTGPARSGPEARVGGGAAGNVAWQAVTYTSVTEGLCLQVRVTGEDPATVCGLEGLGVGTWRTDTAAGTVLAVISMDESSAAATLHLQSGAAVPLPLGTAPEVTKARFFLGILPANDPATSVDVATADGTRTNTLPLE